MTFLESLEAIRRARAWAQSAPRYTGEHVFGPAEGRPLVFGVFGDSLGCGLGVTDVSRTFAGVVARRLAEKHRVLCRIAAVSGAQGPQLLEQPVLGDEDLAAVSIGTNDLLHGAPLRRLEASLARFLDKLSHAERVVVLGPGNVAAAGIFPAALRPFLRGRMLAWEAAMKRLAGRYPNACHIGPSDAGAAAEDFGPDGFHPGDAGQTRIGELVCRRVAP